MKGFPAWLALIFLLVGAAVPVASAQPIAMQAELKVGPVLDVHVTDVAEWGFWLDDGSGLLFRQLTRVETASDALKDRIVSFLPDAEVERNGALWSLHLGHLEIATRASKPKTALSAGGFEVLGGVAVGNSLRVEAAFSAAPRFTRPLVFHFGHNVGIRLEGNIFVGSFTFGAGAQVPVGAYRVTAMGNAWARYFGDEGIHGDIPVEVGAGPSTMAYSVSLVGDREVAETIRLRVGARYFLKDVELDEPESRYEVVVGVSKRL